MVIWQLDFDEGTDYRVQHVYYLNKNGIVETSFCYLLTIIPPVVDEIAILV